jgi:hypothetical protein
VLTSPRRAPDFRSIGGLFYAILAIPEISFMIRSRHAPAEVGLGTAAPRDGHVIAIGVRLASLLALMMAACGSASAPLSPTITV